MNTQKYKDNAKNKNLWNGGQRNNTKQQHFLRFLFLLSAQKRNRIDSVRKPVAKTHGPSTHLPDLTLNLLI